MTDAALTTSSGKKQRRNSRDALMQAASEILIQRNTIDISLSDIAEHSGLNSALIKYHFGNKNGLLLALVERDAGPSMEKLKALSEQDTPPKDKLRMHIAGVIHTYAKCPYLNRLVHTLMENGNDEIAEELVDFFVKPILNAQQRIVEQGVELGIFKPVEPMMFYYLLIGACDYIFYARHSRRFMSGQPELTQATRDQYINFVTDSAIKILAVDDK